MALESSPPDQKNIPLRKKTSLNQTLPRLPGKQRYLKNYIMLILWLKWTLKRI